MKILGHVDNFYGGYLSGWALNPESESPCEIICKDANGLVIAKGLANIPRADLEKIGFPRSDISFKIRVHDAFPTGLIHVLADSTELRNSPVVFEAGKFDGYLDFGGNRIFGWLRQRTESFDPPLVKIHDEAGNLIATVASRLYPERDPDPVFRPARFFLDAPQKLFSSKPTTITARVGDKIFGSCKVHLEPLKQIKAPDEHQIPRPEANPPAEHLASSVKKTVAETNPNEAVSDESAALALVIENFDYAYYLRHNTDVQQAGIDAFDHYYYTGWREGRNPNSDFDTAYYRQSYVSELTDEINPFLHYLTVGRVKGYQPRNQVSDNPTTATSDQAVREVVAAEFSETYYLSTYPDVGKAGANALEHFLITGWREQRNPNSTFDTAFYISRNADIRDTGINPFWHYLVAGRAEGRLSKRAGGYRRDLIEKAHEAALEREQYTQTSGDNLAEDALLAALRIHVDSLHPTGLVVSLSHDCYVRVVGGTQIFISDEQKLFNEYQFSYLHISPKHGQLAFAAERDNDEFLIAADGVYVGSTQASVLLNVLEKFSSAVKYQEKYFVLHSFFGFTPAQITSLAGALSPQRSFYWTHDYSAVCEGYNLLRNDLHFCGAPAPTSMACRVCRYGSGRLSHIEKVKHLFDQLQFEVLAPSERAAHIWQQGVQFNVSQVRAHPHWVLQVQSSDKLPADKSPAHGGASDKVKTLQRAIRIAFIGYPKANKGWQIYKELVEAGSEKAGLEFYHLASANTPSHLSCKFVVTEVTPDDRTRAIATLIEHQIDVVCMLSPWPETFSFVTHEAIMAGIRVVCLADSGNVAALAAKNYRVSVYEDPSALSLGLRSPEFKKQIKADRLAQHRYDATASGATVSIVRKVPLSRLPRVSL